jgi:Ser/Thr protein kinase RdoA (MazF antagonist)
MPPASWITLAGRFDLGTVRGTPAYVARGAMGEIWHLETGRGRWAVKWQFPWAPPDARPYDLEVQRAAAAAGIPLALPVTTPAGEAVIRVGDRQARVYEWVDLGPAGRPPAGPDRARQAGELLGMLHGLAIPAASLVDTWYTSPPRPDAWATLAARAAAAGATWASGLAAARPLIRALTALAVPAPPGRPIACHRDFTPHNVLPRAADGRLVVLDWENAGPLPAGRELGYVLLAWAAADGHFDAAAAGALLAGYRAASGAAPHLEPGLFATAAAVQLNFLHIMAGQALEDPAHRPYAEEQLASLLDHDLEDLRRSIRVASRALDMS